MHTRGAVTAMATRLLITYKRARVMKRKNTKIKEAYQLKMDRRKFNFLLDQNIDAQLENLSIVLIPHIDSTNCSYFHAHQRRCRRKNTIEWDINRTRREGAIRHRLIDWLIHYWNCSRAITALQDNNQFNALHGTSKINTYTSRACKLPANNFIDLNGKSLT